MTMWIFGFHRMYLSIAAGIGSAFLLVHTWWFALMNAVIARVLIAVGEHLAGIISVNRAFRVHAYAFRQELGPYGIRMINRAEKDMRIRKSLAEVFTKSEKKLRKAVEQLEMMETLFKAGMSPDADTWQLHDLKLKYGRFRVAQLDMKKNVRQ